MNDEDYALKWAKKIRAVNLLGGKCVKCGESDVFVLDFHHRGQKDIGVAVLINGQKRWPEIEAEVLKCELLCANCHTEHHCEKTKNGRNFAAKATVLEALGNPVCSQCGQVRGNLSSLEFHHYKGKKEFSISNFFTRKHSTSLLALFEEINKCKIVCRNCHAKMRIDIHRFNRLLASINYKVKNHRSEQKINRDEVIRMYKAGSRVTDIARNLGYNKSTISMLLKRLGLTGKSYNEQKS